MGNFFKNIFNKSDNKSEADIELLPLENNYNYLQYISFSSFISTLVNFSEDNMNLSFNSDIPLNQKQNLNEIDTTEPNLEYSSQDPFFYAGLPENEYFIPFIENKILLNPIIKDKFQQNQEKKEIFKDFLLSLYKTVNNKLSSYLKIKYPNEESYDNFIVNKGNIITFGILFCQNEETNKITLIYNLFKEVEDDGKSIIRKSGELSLFFRTIFIVASYGVANARKSHKGYGKLKPIKEEKINKVLRFTNTKNLNNLIDLVNKNLFGEDENNSIYFQEFKEKFIKKDSTQPIQPLSFMFSPSKIRAMLEKYNIK